MLQDGYLRCMFQQFPSENGKTKQNVQLDAANYKVMERFP